MPNSILGANRSQKWSGKGILKSLLAIGLVTSGFDSSLLAADLVPATKMFPESTQALISLPDTPKFLELWNKTQLGMLAKDEKLKGFWESQRQELQGRLNDAGWQLNFQPDDLEEISAGQTSVGWILRSGEKPYSIGLVIDIADRTEAAEKFLKRVDNQLKEKKADVKTWEASGAKVTQYFVTSATNETKKIESNYTLHGGQLIATDDVQTMKELLEAQSGGKTDSLANSKLYQDSVARVKGDGPAEVEYFVRPIGIAKVLRSIGGKPPKNQQDLLKLLETLGFDALQCAVGHVHFSEEEFDVFHHGFVKLEKPVQEAVKVLDFPNVAKLLPPPWLSKESASAIGLSWNLKDAFRKFEPIVDGYVGDDTFEAMLEGMRDDANGPQIDIEKEVLPYITSEFYIATEIVKPISPESKRSLVLLKLNDPTRKLNRVLDRYGKNESQSEAIDLEGGYRVWSFKNEEEAEVELDFGTPKTNSANKEEEDDAEEPLLDQWAVSIVDGYFVFGSDAELIKELIERVRSNPKTSEWDTQPDVQRAMKMVEAISGGDANSMYQINRADRSFEMQYELFRDGKLNASKSVAAAILDRLLDPKHKNRGQEQKLKGDTLPPFEQIRSYFMPSGSVIRTEDDGWAIQSFVLKKEEK